MKSFPKMHRPPKGFWPRNQEKDTEWHMDLAGMKKKADAKRREAQKLFNQRQDEVINMAGAQHRIAAEKAAAEHKNKDIAAGGDLNTLKKVLMHKCGNLYRAWREVLDVSDRGKISFVGFANACREIGFQGEIRKIWKTLDTDGGGTVGFAEFSPEIATQINAFKKALRDSAGGSLIWGWLRNVDTDRSGRVSLGEFV